MTTLRMTKRDRELIAGIGCTPEQAARYRDFWDIRSTETDDTPDNVQAMSASPPRVYEPVPYEDWSAAAKLIAMLATDSDRGVGDTIKRQLGTAGVLYQAAFKTLTGSGCTGCGFRQTKWNQLYPYS